MLSAVRPTSPYPAMPTAALPARAGLAFAAAAGDLRQATAEQRAAPGTAFELVGADFIADAALRPWLLEVNAVPSLARKARPPP